MNTCVDLFSVLLIKNIYTYTHTYIQRTQVLQAGTKESVMATTFEKSLRGDAMMVSKLISGRRELYRSDTKAKP